MGRLESPSGPSGSRQDPDDDDSKGHKKRTRLNSDQGALLKKVWREVRLVPRVRCVVIVELIESRSVCHLDLFPEYRTSIMAGRTDRTNRQTSTSLVPGTSGVNMLSLNSIAY